MKKRAWKPLADAKLRNAVEERIKTSVELLRDPSTIKKHALERDVKIRGWSPLSLGSGYPGLCLLFGELDRLEPEAGWDMAGHQVLVAVQQAVQEHGVPSLDLWGGLAGIVLGVRSLSRGGTRYAGMMESLNRFATEQLPEFIETRTDRLANDLRMTDYDLMGGMTGVGRYLLAFRDEPQLQPVLEGVIRYLIALSGEKEVEGQLVPMWHISSDNQFLAIEREFFKQGMCNAGLSHGIAGPMGVLALAKLHGVETTGQDTAIRRYAEWLVEQKLEDEYGPYWPGRIPMEVVSNGWEEGKVVPPNESWCYGGPSIARQLWFAGMALGETAWQELAMEVAVASYKRTQNWNEKTGLSSPNFCHGVAGTAYMAQVMYAETGNELFAEARDRLVERVLDLFDEELPYHVFELTRDPNDPNGTKTKVSDMGLLEGLAGTLTVLTSLLTEEAPEWDAVFLLS
ncbi:lanthionine synthetase C family protein [Tumebacillus amylolyticus]|nr:lanthionine synthetase C family protein [Tumebacillus amylolyticus]